MQNKDLHLKHRMPMIQNRKNQNIAQTAALNVPKICVKYGYVRHVGLNLEPRPTTLNTVTPALKNFGCGKGDSHGNISRNIN